MSINIKDKVYYIGFSPINGICNESFFEGSITMYPNNEKGNISFSDKVIDDERSDFVVQEFRKFILEKVWHLISIDSNVKFMIFNDKERTKKLCSFIPEENRISGNSLEVLEYLNSKEKIRKKFIGSIPILDYKWKNGFEINNSFVDDFLNKQGMMVIQGEIGSGGVNTYLIKCINDFNSIELFQNARYGLSAYKPNLPINVTVVIGKEILLLPISAQLIINENGRFIYKGADFTYPKQFNIVLKKRIKDYSLIIAKDIKNMGYKGILGIDFIIDNHQNVYFMELNPRYQASSFYISRKLECATGLNLAFLQYLALINEPFPEIDPKLLEDVQGSFLNCNNKVESIGIVHDYEVKNGYFPQLKSSIYRRVYHDSIICKYNFEKIEMDWNQLNYSNLDN